MDGGKHRRRTFLQSLTTGAIAGALGLSNPVSATGATGQDVSDGNVIYAFAPDRVAVIDPEAGEVLAEITSGITNVSWGDPIAVPEQNRLFVNAVNNAQVIVFDTDEQAIEDRVEIGPDPVHMYNPVEGELWSHADAEGAFYVVDAADLSVTDRVVAALEDTAHGKLTFHEELGDKAYATNTNDPGLHVVDLAGKETTGFVETCAADDGEDGSTHAATYNPVSDRTYAECLPPQSGSAAVDVSDDTVAEQFDVAGTMVNTPDDRFVVWVDKTNDKLEVLDAEAGEFAATIPVEGGPDGIEFRERDGTLLGFTANTLTSDTAVVDFEELSVVTRIEAGEIARPEGADTFHRTGLAAGGYFVTPASGDGVVSVIDAEALELHAKVPVAEGVEGVAYVGAPE